MMGARRTDAWTHPAEAQAMERTEGDWADRLGKLISSVVIVLMALFFAYGFLGWMIFG